MAIGVINKKTTAARLNMPKPTLTNANIETLMERARHTAVIRLDSIRTDFREFWDRIGAIGDFRAALRSWDTPRNTSA